MAVVRTSVTVVRPYGERIRKRVFEELSRAGLAMKDAAIVPPEATDEEAVRAVIEANNRVLLVPFHAHRHADGHVTDGVRFLERLAETIGSMPYRVVMPVSRFGAGGLSLAWERLPEEIREQILIVDEDDLANDALPRKVAEHVRD